MGTIATVLNADWVSPVSRCLYLFVSPTLRPACAEIPCIFFSQAQDNEQVWEGLAQELRQLLCVSWFLLYGPRLILA